MSDINNEKDFRRRMKLLVEYKIGEFNEPIRREINGMPGSGDEIDDIMLDEDKEKGEGDNGVEGKAPDADPGMDKPSAPAPEGNGGGADISKDEIGNIAPPPSSDGAEAPKPEAKPDMEAVFSQQMEKMNAMFDSMKSMLDGIMQQQGSQTSQVKAELEQVKADLDEIRPPTPEEQFDMISRESYPYNLKISDVWKDYFNEETPEEINNSTTNTKEYKMDVQDALRGGMDDEELKDSLDLK